MGKRKGSTQWKHITIFDRPYSMEKQAEGMAIHQSVATGACDRCGCLKQCSSNENFKPPIFAYCSRRKHEILSALQKGDRGGVSP